MDFEKLDTLFEDLKQQRDELRLKIHLAKAEARTEWENLESRWDEIKPKLDQAKNDAANTASEVLGALELAGEAIKKGYHRIKRDLD